MADQNVQPTVLVKKSDGTFVRMTLDEVKKMKGGGNAGIASSPAQAPRNDSKAQVAVDLPAGKPKSPKEILHYIQDDIVKEIASSPSKADPRNDRTREIASSPLRAPRNDNVYIEELSEKDGATPLVSVPRTNQAEEIIKKLGFSVPADYLNRLRSLIQLRLKDVRSEAQTMDAAMRAYGEGGLSLRKEEAEKLVVACRVKSGALNEIASSPLQAPRNDSKTIEILRSVQDDRVKKGIASSSLQAARNDNRFVPKAVIRDVVAKPTNMGPVDEIRYFNLTDFRRLSSNPQEASRRLRQKFFALRDESYLMYLDALKAWNESPLFKSYMEIVHDAIVSKKNLSSDVDKNKIQLPEILAIIAMEKDLV